jgi:protein involved in polysaccharide export with SLBB domain
VLLPGIGEVSLAGVPRRGIETYLTTELARYLKNPVVHARVLVRLGILGEVERPGYYAVPADAVLTDALMAAGGPTRDAKFVKVVIERDAQRLWEGDDLQRAIAQGMTVSQMKLRSGDRIVVPRRRDSATTAQILSLMLTIPAAIYGLTRLF